MECTLICPICKGVISLSEKAYYCDKKHCFDVSKSGYVNLLPSNKMNSKNPGDNKLMVDSRRSFLQEGYYDKLKQTLCNRVLECAEAFKRNTIRVGDIGCGEGYYTNAMNNAFKHTKKTVSFVGVDISKRALELASKSANANNVKNTQYVVASSFELPIQTKSCEVITVLFAPLSTEEIARVLTNDGFFVMVIPAKRHLIELKKAVYENAYENEVKSYEIEGFQLVNKDIVTDEITVKGNQSIKNLFTMTPYYYKTSIDDTKKLDELDELTTTIDFEILTYKKSR